MTYEGYVTAAKLKLKSIESIQHEIASMAIKVCEIRHGGASGEYYTLSQFADDIGVNRKTLSNWVHVYRDILLRLDKPNPTKKEWDAARQTERTLKFENTAKQAAEGTTQKKLNYRKHLPVEKIEKIFNDFVVGKTDIRDLNNLQRQSKHLKFLANKIQLSDVDDDILKEIVHNLDCASQMIHKHLNETENVLCDIA